MLVAVPVAPLLANPCRYRTVGIYGLERLMDGELQRGLLFTERGTSYVDTMLEHGESVGYGRLDTCRVYELTRWGVDVEACSSGGMESNGLTIEGEGKTMVICNRRDTVFDDMYLGLVPDHSCSGEYVGLSNGGTLHDIEVRTAIREKTHGVVAIVAAVDKGICPALVRSSEQDEAAVFIVKLEIRMELVDAGVLVCPDDHVPMGGYDGTDVFRVC